MLLSKNVQADTPWVTYEGADGPGKGRHIVLVSGDEEYRSEEALPQLAKILAFRQGFKCTVLFAIDPADGTINPIVRDEYSGPRSIGRCRFAGAVYTLSRASRRADEAHCGLRRDDGRPIVALRTSTHAFDNKTSVKYARYAWQSPEWDGGFGRQVLGETWINHHGQHGKQSTRGLIAPGVRRHPILRGIKDGDIWGTTDVYGVRLPLPGDSQAAGIGAGADRA